MSGRDELLALCAGLPAAELTYPFGDDTAVFKVGGKMFALVSLNDANGRISLKAEPDEVLLLTAQHPTISRGYHLNKRHWITVDLDPAAPPLPASLVPELVKDSYRLVVGGLSAAARAALAGQRP